MQKKYNDLYQLTDINSNCDRAKNLLAKVEGANETVLHKLSFLEWAIKHEITKLPNDAKKDDCVIKLKALYTVIHTMNEPELTIKNKTGELKHVIDDINNTATGVNSAIKKAMTRDEGATNHE